MILVAFANKRTKKKTDYHSNHVFPPHYIIHRIKRGNYLKMHQFGQHGISNENLMQITAHQRPHLLQSPLLPPHPPIVIRFQTSLQQHLHGGTFLK